MLKLHSYFRSSASYRCRIALNLKGLPYELAFVHLVKDGGQQNAPNYRALNPQGLLPTLEHDGRVLTQSLAIIEYLEETWPEPHLLPGDAETRARVRAFALAIASDTGPVNNLRVLRYLKRTAEAGAAGDRCLVPALVGRRAQGLRGPAARGSAHLLLRRAADAGRHRPRPAALQRAPLQDRPLGRAAPRRHRCRLLRPACLRQRRTRGPARCGVMPRSVIPAGARQRGEPGPRVTRSHAAPGSRIFVERPS